MSRVVIPGQFTLEALQQAFRALQQAIVSPTPTSTAHADLRGLRLTNAGASVDPTDYTTRGDVDGLIAAFKAQFNLHLSTPAILAALRTTPLGDCTGPELMRLLSRRQPSLGDFDPDDGGGVVSRVCPPEQVIPPGPTQAFWRGDFGGVTLAQNPADVPLVPGCNTTPRNMMISFLLPFYTRVWQDIILTEHAWRSYTHFHLDRVNSDSAGLTPTQFVDLMAYIQTSYGMWTSYWGIGTPDGTGLSSWAAVSSLYLPTLNALIAAGPTVCEKTILIVGEELNTCTSPDGLADIVTHLSPICAAHGIEMALHFTSRYPAWPTDAEIASGDGFGGKVQFWIDMKALGVQRLCYQAIPTDPAGTMAAAMFDTRTYMGIANTSLLFTAFELCAEEQLFGHRTEQDGCRLGLEMTFATRGGTDYPPVAGYGNGGCLIGGCPL